MKSLSKAIDTAYEAVSTFHRHINHPNPNEVTFFEQGVTDNAPWSRNIEAISDFLKTQCKHQPKLRRLLRVSWMLEEVSEFLAAETEEAQVDALCDVLFFVLGTFGEMGYKPGNAFEAVLDANMRKNPSVNGEKVTKPAGWVGPESEIRKDIARQKEYISACAGE